MAAIDPTRAPTVYERSATGLPDVRRYVRQMWERRPLIWHLARTDLKAEHYDTVFGQVWIVLNPLFMAAVYYLVRSVVRPAGSPEMRNILIAHLVWGVFFFHYTSGTLQRGSRSLLSGKGLILNASFPRAILPTCSVIKAMLDFVPTILIYLVFHIVLGQPLGAALVWLPLIFALQTLLNFGTALLFAPLVVLFRDTTAFLPYMTRVWLYTTPVLYTVREIPDHLRAYLKWNPLYPFYGALEHVFHAQTPSMAYVAGAAAWAFAFFAVGATVFLWRERELAVRL
jgi:teichoic acid transport system permease protein